MNRKIHVQFHGEWTLMVNITPRVCLPFTNQIVVKDDDKFSLLFYLIDSGYANINMVDKLLKKEIDINEWHNGRTLLDSITYQLTKVGR